MAVDPTATAQRLVAVLSGLTGMQSVMLGVPESLGTRVAAYVTFDRWGVDDRIGGLGRYEVDFQVTFGYRVAGAEPAVETDLMAMVGRFTAAVMAERRTQFAGTCSSVPAGFPDFSRAASPQYAPFAGVEFRLYPGIVRAIFQETY